MLERYGVIEGDWRNEERVRVEVVDDLPLRLREGSFLAEKLRRDRQKLLTLVQFARHEGDPREFLRRYFFGE
jgi:hypothetical protein